MTQPRVVVVTKSTAYRRFVEARGDPLTDKLLREHDPTVANLQRAHEEHETTLAEVLRILRALPLRIQVVGLPHQPFSNRGVKLVVTVGGDGTLLAASSQCDQRTPILGINSAPTSSVGFFCGLKAGDDLERGLHQATTGKMRSLQLARMEVRLNRRVVTKRVLNEALFCHSCPAATSRYLARLGDIYEEHKSSGLWIGPAAGSTAAQRSAGGSVLPLTSNKLQMVVREPYFMGRKLRLAKKLIPEESELELYNKMREASLFLDGAFSSIPVGLGARLIFRVSDDPLHVLGLSKTRGRTRSSG